MSKTKYRCDDCQKEYTNWIGKCTACGLWNTIQPVVTESKRSRAALESGELSSLGELYATHTPEYSRISTGSREFDHVLGGGMVPGSVILLGGDPGIGKSTLMLQFIGKIASNKHSVLYVSGEESLNQVAMRARRLNIENPELKVLSQTNVSRVCECALENKTNILIIDSIQTMCTDEVSSQAGSVNQVKACANELVQFAKAHQMIVFLIGHVTKEGAIAGPRILEHMVDTVLYFENEKTQSFRLIRAIKNRFGPVSELGIFSMTTHGLSEVENPSAAFLNHGEQAREGTATMVTWEGSRPLLIEVQALVDSTNSFNPKRVAVGYENNRLHMLLAVISRYSKANLHQKDVFVNITGGLKVTETAADLAVMLAIYSSLTRSALPRDTIWLGEVGLSGDLKSVLHAEDRVKAALRHGYGRIYLPNRDLLDVPKKAELNVVSNVQKIFNRIGATPSKVV